MTDRTSPLWHRALPLVALIPTAVVPNGSLISLAIVLLALWLVRDSRRPSLAFKGQNWPRWALIGIAAGAAFWALSHFLVDPLLGRLFAPVDLTSVAKVKGNLPNYLVLLAVGFIFGGVIEELVFRGFVIGWGAVLFGERAVIPLFLLSSTVFGLGHLYQGWSGVISTGASGLLFGALYIASGRKLLPAMLAHMTLDAIGVTALYLGYAA